MRVSALSAYLCYGRYGRGSMLSQKLISIFTMVIYDKRSLISSSERPYSILGNAPRLSNAPRLTNPISPLPSPLLLFFSSKILHKVLQKNPKHSPNLIHMFIACPLVNYRTQMPLQRPHPFSSPCKHYASSKQATKIQRPRSESDHNTTLAQENRATLQSARQHNQSKYPTSARYYSCNRAPAL